MYQRRGYRWAVFLGAVALCSALSPYAALAQPSGIDPKAENLLRTATTFLAGQQKFAVDTRSSIEGVLESGQKIQFDQGTMLSVERPDKLRAERRGDLVDQVFYYDGGSLTLYNPSNGYYATVDAPATLEEALDFARETLHIIAPAGDLLYKNAFDILMQGVTSGFVVGKSVVEGVPCDHLAFRAPPVDWQIWIQEGDEPLPRKLVITSTDVVGAPQFEVVMTQWDLAPDLESAMFQFAPPSGAEQIEFLALGAGAAASQ